MVAEKSLRPSRLLVQALTDDSGCGSRSQHPRPWWLHRLYAERDLAVLEARS